MRRFGGGVEMAMTQIAGDGMAFDPPFDHVARQIGEADQFAGPVIADPFSGGVARGFDSPRVVGYM